MGNNQNNAASNQAEKEKEAQEGADTQTAQSGTAQNGTNTGSGTGEEKANPEKEVTKEQEYETAAEKFAALGKKKGKKVKCEFTNSPTGLLNLGYNVGEEASFDEKQVEMLMELGLAKRI